MLQKILVISIFFTTSLFAQSKVTRILIIGDSLTEGYGVAKNDAYPRQTKILLTKQGKNVEIISAGSSGSTSASAEARLKWHLKKKPDILILALGGNDGLRGINPKTTFLNLDKTISLAKLNSIKVYLAGMKMPHNYGEEYQTMFENTFQKLINKHKIKSIPFLLKDVGGRKELNLADGIHPNEKGHQIIAKNLAQIIGKDL